jgi:hypothetical protein
MRQTDVPLIIFPQRRFPPGEITKGPIAERLINCPHAIGPLWVEGAGIMINE